MVSSLAPQASASANSATPARKGGNSLDRSIPSYFCPWACQAPNRMRQGEAGKNEVGRHTLGVGKQAGLGGWVGHRGGSFWGKGERGFLWFYRGVCSAAGRGEKGRGAT